MSLSKFFKKTEIFQAEKLTTTVTPIADWKAHDLLHKEPKDTFAPQDLEDEASQATFKEIIKKEQEKKEQDAADKAAAPEPELDQDSRPPADAPQNTPLPKPPPPPQPLLSKEEIDAKINKALEQGRQEGYKDGFQKGKNEGIAQGQSETSPEYESIISALTVVFQQVETYRDNIVQNSAKEMRDTTLAFVEKIVRFSVKHNDATILLTLEEALQHAIKSSEFCIHINPDDYDVVQENSESFIATISGLESIVLKKNPSIERGGAYIESDNCIVDATIASQLEQIYNEFKL